MQSSNLTVALANTAPTVPATPTLRRGHRTARCVNPANIYVGVADRGRRDRRPTRTLAGPLTYVWSGQPCGGLGESLGCLFASDASGYPGGSCRGITITPDPVMPGKATFTAPTVRCRTNPNVCGLRVVVTDAAGGTYDEELVVRI